MSATRTTAPTRLVDDVHDGLPVARDRIAGRIPGNRRVCFLEIKCPYCGRTHEHSWHAEDGFDALSHRNAHCGDRVPEAVKGKGYFIGLDAMAEHNIRNLTDRQFERLELGRKAAVEP